MAHHFWCKFGSSCDRRRPTHAVVAEWQTHQLEGLAVATPWRFESSRPHHTYEYDESRIPCESGGFFILSVRKGHDGRLAAENRRFEIVTDTRDA